MIVGPNPQVFQWRLQHGSFLQRRVYFTGEIAHPFADDHPRFGPFLMDERTPHDGFVCIPRLVELP